MKEEKQSDNKLYRNLIIALLFTASVLFLSQGISIAEEKIKESVKEGAKETAEAVSETTKEIAEEVRKKKRMVVEEIKEGWLSVKKSVKGAYGSAKVEVTDTAITTNVKTKLLASKKREDFEDIAVSTKDRKVTLTGKVTSPKDAADAIEIALSVRGVERVNSRIEVVEECH